MKRGKKLSVLLLALMVMSGAAFMAIRLNSESKDADSGKSIFTLDAEGATKLSWSYNGETVTLVKSGSGAWSYEGGGNYQLDESYISAMLTALSEITAVKTIENVDNPAEYGLDEPTCSIAVTTETTSDILIGDETSIGGQRYLSLGDGNVYIVDSTILNDFSYGLNDIVKK